DIMHKLITGKIFYAFLTGGAGAGKSVVIKTIVQNCLRNFSMKTPTVNPDEVCVLVSAFTGKAAFQVFGMTIHGAFKLPPTQSTGKLHPLEDSAVNSIRKFLRRCRLYIFDEVSMISSRHVEDINQRLKQIHQSDEDFG